MYTPWIVFVLTFTRVTTQRTIISLDSLWNMHFVGLRIVTMIAREQWMKCPLCNRGLEDCYRMEWLRIRCKFQTWGRHFSDLRAFTRSFYSREVCTCTCGKGSMETNVSGHMHIGSTLRFRPMACFCGDRWEIKFFQDDVRERKEEEEKDIGDLHRWPIDNSLAAESSSSLQCAICRTWFNLIPRPVLERWPAECSSLWKQATTNEIQDD